MSQSDDTILKSRFKSADNALMRVDVLSGVPSSIFYSFQLWDVGGGHTSSRSRLFFAIFSKWHSAQR
jgi:hypothetical protein